MRVGRGTDFKVDLSRIRYRFGARARPDGYVAHHARVLLDSASQTSAITVACTDRLRLKRDRWTSRVTGLRGVPVVDVKGRVELCVQPRFAVEPVLQIHAWMLPAITGDMPRDTLPINH
jgi:hypothetical protein